MFQVSILSDHLFTRYRSNKDLDRRKKKEKERIIKNPVEKQYCISTGDSLSQLIFFNEASLKSERIFIYFKLIPIHRFTHQLNQQHHNNTTLQTSFEIQGSQQFIKTNYCKKCMKVFYLY